MTDYLLTALIPMALFFVVLYGSKESENQKGFMSREYTTIMKAVCCIIVILVHIPAAYTNRLQDAMGSFAYVCVTLFFLMSAYGMSLSKERRRNYMHHHIVINMEKGGILFLSINIYPYCATNIYQQLRN